ncbi:MAG TPA: hypothetical protein VGV18_10075 [Verrucomicrobiae bacterium]|nr:hypothetical protein [Verrucomicrobiae bacterium]
MIKKALFTTRAGLRGLASLIILLLCRQAALAGGPQGYDNGWAIDYNNNGACLLTPTICSKLVAAKAGYIRIGFTLGFGHTNWDSTILGDYDTAVNNARNAGLEIIGLIPSGAWPGGQSSWNANSYECNGGNGDNSWINNYAQNAVVPIVQHFNNRIKIWEIWNEPNACTTCQSCGTQGGTFVYPSIFAQILAYSYADLEYAGLKSGNTVLSGGLFGQSIGNVYSYQNAGGQYLDDTYNVGINDTGAFGWAKSHWNTYPLDAIGQHVYIDQGGATSSSEFGQYLAWVRQAYTKYEGSGTSKGTIITEFGWTTASVSQSVQDQNMNTAFGVIEGGSYNYVKHAIWFQFADNCAAGMYYGVVDCNYNPKTAYNDSIYWQQYEGYRANGTVDNNILNYYNARGQAVLGDAFDNGGSPFVHTWSGNGYSASVQDFAGGSNGNVSGGVNIQDSSQGTYEINDVHGMCDFYLAHGGIGSFGSPKNDEYSYGSGTRQDFQAHYLTWDPTNGVVEH